MSTVIGVMGQSGHGKTTAMRTLDPASTYYIDADCKGLPWRGWRGQYHNRSTSRAPGGDGGNYMATPDPAVILQEMQNASKSTMINVVVVDTINAVMIHEEMTRMREKGYDKWVDICQSVYDIVDGARKLRHDLIVVLCFHVQGRADGEGVDHILTNGRKLEKVHLEFMLTTLLYAKCRQTEKGNEYFFEVQANQSTAKSPMGLFSGMEIPNDMQAVVDALRAYQEGDEIETVPTETATSATPSTRPEEPQADDVALLIDLMAIDGISNKQMSDYASERGKLAAGDLQLERIEPAALHALVQPDTWAKVRIKLCPHLAAIKDAMDKSGVTNIALDNLCKVNPGKIAGLREPWWDSEKEALERVLRNWEKAAEWMDANMPF